ncbi:MAG TPA: dihydrodipicolinate synthase family protein [Tepidisphaeraceae bacterium]|nr:dihydrodipicolinate synthase family protein [Tepidisphaeraceae bacterium]
MSEDLTPANNNSRAVQTATLISAIGTPLNDAELLHEDGLAAHIDDQWSNGISGLLVAGTMGLLQLLRDETYAALVRRSVEFSRGKGEILVGAGDCGFARTRERILFLNTQDVDGVVVLAPYFLTFTQPELLDYFNALAGESRAPLYLYDLPQRTRCKIELPTALALSKHSNIRGIKCSDQPTYARELRDALGAEGDEQFRIVIAQAAMVDIFLRGGFREHLDGMFAIAPHWTVEIGRCAQRGDWEAAAVFQRRLNALQHLVIRYGVFPTMTVVLNARGIPGTYAPRPLKPLDSATRDLLLADAAMTDLLRDNLATV